MLQQTFKVLAISYLIFQAYIFYYLKSNDYEFDNDYFNKDKENVNFKLPILIEKARWVDLYNGIHFDYYQNGMDDIRPPAIILFHGHKQCPKAIEDLQFHNLASNSLPSIERLIIYKYDMDAAPLRLVKFTPEMDLKSKFKVSECPTLVFVPKSCDGWTKWCTKKVFHKTLGNITQVGCDNYKESCINTKQYVFKEKGYNQTELINWIENELKIEGEPKIAKNLQTYKNQEKLLLAKHFDHNDKYRSLTYSYVIPKYTELGFLGLETPKVLQDIFINYLKQNIANVRTETFHDGYSIINHYESLLKFINFPMNDVNINLMATHLLPVLQSWSGVNDLQLTSIYGMRLYYPGCFLLHHMDRPNTHIISVTFAIAKLDVRTFEVVEEKDKQEGYPFIDDNNIAEEDEWPLEIFSHDGDIYRYPHKAGTMVIYESAKCLHGRPYKNPKYIHVGLFVHYKPAQYEKVIKDIEDIEIIINKENGKYGYTSTASKEPENPIYSEKSYGKVISEY